MNFNDFKGSKKGGAELSGDARKMVSDFLMQYNGKSEAELMDTIMKTATEYRRAGRLSDADIDGFYQMLSPMLDKKKREKLDEVVRALKNIK